MRQEKRTETITYIVDESYRIQYMSKALAKQFSDFEPGEICYEKFRGREKPCRNCPLAHPNRKTDLFYNEDQGEMAENQCRRGRVAGSKELSCDFGKGYLRGRYG